MNAYELADKLQELDSRLHLIDLFKSADMLRQQADRIAELENEITFWKNLYKDLTNVLDEHKKFTPQINLLSDNERRYKWLRTEFEAGRETYLAEGMPSGEALDEYIDKMMGVK